MSVRMQPETHTYTPAFPQYPPSCPLSDVSLLSALDLFLFPSSPVVAGVHHEAIKQVVTVLRPRHGPSSPCPAQHLLSSFSFVALHVSNICVCVCEYETDESCPLGFILCFLWLFSGKGSRDLKRQNSVEL